MQNLVLENNTQELSLDEMVQIEAGDDCNPTGIVRAGLSGFFGGLAGGALAGAAGGPGGVAAGAVLGGLGGYVGGLVSLGVSCLIR